MTVFNGGLIGGGEGSQVGFSHRAASTLDGRFRFVAGAVDVDPQRARDFGVSLGLDPSRAYGDWRAMAGFDVLCEKPMTMTLEEGRALVEVVERSGRDTVSTMHVRADLADAHRSAWDALTRSGTWWTGAQRAELAATALAAMTSASPLPPWTAPSTIAGVLADDLLAPAVAHDAIYRVAAHAATLTESWYEGMRNALTDLAYVEVVAIACNVAAIVSFRRAAGLAPWHLSAARGGEPTRTVPPDLVDAKMNWVRVIAPADETAAVVQAFTSVPAELDRLWMLAAAQYIPNLEMVDPLWNRGTLSRPQAELVAARISQLRECFY
jgi:hypothetical protein